MTPTPSREPGQADAALEADIAAFLTEMKRWNKPPRTAALTVRIIAERTRDKKRIGELEKLSLAYLEFFEHVGGCRDCLAMHSRDHTRIPDNAEARALLGEVQDAK